MFLTKKSALSSVLLCLVSGSAHLYALELNYCCTDMEWYKESSAGKIKHFLDPPKKLLRRFEVEKIYIKNTSARAME